ncbi:uncharacterized protein F4822DRAFT_323291 [Hypoxylon trugodes]|uniref:uncharacterized protein n=1 Tax=Hypoxylon trugodes TaxID=326681 RepID=UPI00219B6E6A|nr:uncharacterized protein F4822DRAFT_323291 [Hypoxylon trugodes]KAI1386656.1 hypothetical protein F4822DRAFT_323291 [Hypoxylon trugodes]
MSLEEHNAYYCAVFDQVLQEIASRDDIPNAVMEPPAESLTLTFYGGWNNYLCLGCADFYDTEDIVHAETYARKGESDGITKDDLIRTIGEVLYGGLHTFCRDSKEEIGIIPSRLDWMGTTSLCTPVDNILYIGYVPTAEISSTADEKYKSEGRASTHREYGVKWEPMALGSGAWGIQGYYTDYAEKLLLAKGLRREDADVYLGY